MRSSRRRRFTSRRFKSRRRRRRGLRRAGPCPWSTLAVPPRPSGRPSPGYPGRRRRSASRRRLSMRSSSRRRRFKSRRFKSRRFKSRRSRRSLAFKKQLRNPRGSTPGPLFRPLRRFTSPPNPRRFTSLKRPSLKRRRPRRSGPPLGRAARTTSRRGWRRRWRRLRRGAGWRLRARPRGSGLA